MADIVAVTEIIPVARAVIQYRIAGNKEAVFSERLDGESVQGFFSRVGKTVDELLEHAGADIKYVRFSTVKV